MQRLIRFSTVCLQKFLLKFEYIKWKLPPNNPKIGNGLVQLIGMGKYIGINGLIEGYSLKKNMEQKWVIILPPVFVSFF